MTEDYDKVCNILDKLTLDALTLVEEEVQLKLNLEDSMCNGENNLAKCRFILGHNMVSALQVPVNSDTECKAAARVHSEEREKLFDCKEYDLEIVNAETDEEVNDPIKWFGYLVPQNLRYAQKLYRQALQWAVQATNVQTQLQQTYTKIDQLKQYKRTLTKT